MKKYSRKIILAALALTLIIGVPYIKTPGTCGITLPLAFTGAILGCSNEKEAAASANQNQSSIAAASDNQKKSDNKSTGKLELKVTFVELGSENCIPCKMMKPVMEKVEKQYPGQVKVVFHDVGTQKGKSEAYKYGIRVIPTQVFIDKDNKEYFRHEGFYPFEEIDKILKQKGVI